MTIKVGSANAAKVAAVREIIAEYPHLAGAAVIGQAADSGVAVQPKTLDETIRGAMNRARAVYQDCDYGIGLESGLFAVPHTKSGYMDVCAAAIYDGQEFHLGLSSAWEFPDKKITGAILQGDTDMSEAVNRAGLTDNKDIGAAEGAIGILTKGRLNRKEYTKQALRTALIHLEP